jgi:isochorismate synthase
MKDNEALLKYRLPGSSLVERCPLVLREDNLRLAPAAYAHPFITGENKSRYAHDKAEHEQMVQRVIDRMRKGEVDKVVLSRLVKASFPKPPDNKAWEDVFDWLAKSHPRAFVYQMHHPVFGSWIGATPEALLIKKDCQYSTMSLAGTRSAGGEQLPWGEKEKTEQAFVTDYIVRSIQPLAVSILCSDPYTITAGALEHIRTDIRFESRASLSQILSVLHPTPAVAGTPLNAAMALIAEEEKHARSLYAGFIGVHLPDDSYAVFVNLRCMQWTKDAAWIYVGGGITVQSEPTAEWNETMLKSRTMMDALEKTGLVTSLG